MSNSGPFFMSNAFLERDYQLAVDPTVSSFQLVLSASPGLQWYTNSTAAANKQNFYTTYLGLSYCLDILRWSGANTTTPVLSACSSASAGQQWTSTPVGNGYQRLSNDWTGAGWYMDTYSDDHRAFMGQNDTTGTEWMLTPVNQNAITTTAGSQSSTASPTQTVMSAASTSPTGPDTSLMAAPLTTSPAGLDATTKVGIGIGVGLGVPLLVVLVVLAVFLARRQKNIKPADESSAMNEAPFDPKVPHEVIQELPIKGCQTYPELPTQDVFSELPSEARSSELPLRAPSSYR